MPTRFFVLPDDGLNPLLNTISSAQRALDIYLFRLENAAVESAILAAHKRGVKVRAVIDRIGSSQQTYDRLCGAGTGAHWSPGYFIKTHAKALVVDGTTALVTTMNFVEDWEDIRDYGVITDDPATVAAVHSTFTADWEYQQGEPTAAEVANLAVSPVNSRAQTLVFIGQAQHNLWIEQEQFDDREIAAAIAAQANAGLDVRLLFGQKASAELIEWLGEFAPATQVRYLTDLRPHCKLLLRDRAAIHVGSLNLTTESLDQRREISLLISDPASVQRAAATFAADWRAAGGAWDVR